MRKPIVAGNWKMNRTVAEARDLVEQIKVELADQQGVDVEAERAAATETAPGDPYAPRGAQTYPATSYGVSNAPAAHAAGAPIRIIHRPRGDIDGSVSVTPSTWCQVPNCGNQCLDEKCSRAGANRAVKTRNWAVFNPSR